MSDRNKPITPSSPLLTVDEVRAIQEVNRQPLPAPPDQIILRAHLDALVELALGGPLGWHGGKLLTHKSTTDVEVIGWLEKMHAHASVIKNAQDANIAALVAHSSLSMGALSTEQCDCGREQWPHERTHDCLEHENLMREVRKEPTKKPRSPAHLDFVYVSVVDNPEPGCELRMAKDSSMSKFSQEVSQAEVKTESTMVPCPLCGGDMVWNDEVAAPGEADWCQGCRDAAVSLINQDGQDDEVISDLGTQLRLVMGRGPAADLIKGWQTHIDSVVPSDDETPSGDVLDG